MNPNEPQINLSIIFKTDDSKSLIPISTLEINYRFEYHGRRR